ncbi:hypothetical protein PPACK8108_LOCUS3566 [Phakopsora pachyrhizi]|uniref:Uncharacterized protein n=1 Tax=Phakopsora pachyrhizi TaxID=170000 RepID=A0AAV0AMF3_PHAPC|nr:hypothetical protein PPACK8108_LOCUS3566 [Phakopsora pachyrhizi]
MKPDGSLPAYEWNFSNLNPPSFQDRAEDVYKRRFTILRKGFSKKFAKFHMNVFDGGFLGHDNIDLSNQSEPHLTGGSLGQADGTAWMAFFALNMLNMALKLAKNNQVNEDIASNSHNEQSSLWNSKDGFYYNAIRLIPIYATLTLELGVLKILPGFKKRMDWFTENRPEFVTKNIISNMMSIAKQLPRTPRRLRSSADHYFAESAPPTTAESVSSTNNGGHFGTANSGFEGQSSSSVDQIPWFVQDKNWIPSTDQPSSAIGGSPTATPLLLPLSPPPSNVSDKLRSLYQNLIQSPFFDQYSITFIDAKLNKGYKAWTNWVILVNFS